MAPRANCPMVGIGASAGGIDALRRFFPKVDPANGLAFIVVLHLAPNHQSLLAGPGRLGGLADDKSSGDPNLRDL